MAILDKDKHIFSILILFPPILHRLAYVLQHLLQSHRVGKRIPALKTRADDDRLESEKAKQLIESITNKG